LSYKQVGAALNLSENTVKYHMARSAAPAPEEPRAGVAYAKRSGLAAIRRRRDAEIDAETRR